MGPDAVAQVRRFNRTVSEHIGALNDRYLGGERALGEARVLWEIGPEGCELRALRSRLGLDSGYTSRLIRSLEASGLVTVAPSTTDRRARVATLTRRGRAERARLDERSDDLARSLLAPLSATQQEDLLGAMRAVERLLSAAVVDIRPVDPAHPDAQRCLEAYFAELRRRSDRPFDPAVGSTAEPHELRPPAGVMLVAHLRAEPVGCGAVKRQPDGACDIKRMWIADTVRGRGLGRRMLAELEGWAAAQGARTVRLETNGALTEAIALYRSTGYVEVPAFNDEPFADHWFEKRL